MIELSNYKKRLIAHTYKDTQSSWDTIRKFNISYKDLYRVIETSRIASFKIVEWIRYKKCCSCKTFLPYNEDLFYKRKWTKYLYSSCKKCMWLLAKTYKIINKEKLSMNNNIRSKQYYYSHRNTIKKQKRRYYNNNKYTILNNKKLVYILGKRDFIRRFLGRL